MFQKQKINSASTWCTISMKSLEIEKIIYVWKETDGRLLYGIKMKNIDTIYGMYSSYLSKYYPQLLISYFEGKYQFVDKV